MSAAPNPLRAVLFADMVDSTGVYESLGDNQALSLVNMLFKALTGKVVANSGTVVKTLGDGMVCRFATADAAFRAACAMQAATYDLAPRAPGALAIKVAVNYGPVVLKGNDVFGDTVNVCARLAALANPSQVLTAAPAVAALSRAHRLRCRQLYPIKLKGRGEPVTVYDVLWRVDPDLTETLPHDTLAAAGLWALKLVHAGESFDVEQHAEARIGRDASNDLVVASARASRMHARIYARDGNFVIVDQSSNGTFLMMDGNSTEVRLRREEAVLGERGWIGLGGSAARHGDHVLRYRRVRRKA